MTDCQNEDPIMILVKRIRDCQRQVYSIGLKFYGKDRLEFQMFEKAFADAAENLISLQGRAEQLDKWNRLLKQCQEADDEDIEELEDRARGRVSRIAAGEKALAKVISKYQDDIKALRAELLSLSQQRDRLKDALKQANSYIDATPLMPGNSYKEIKAVIRSALECDREGTGNG